MSNGKEGPVETLRLKARWRLARGSIRVLLWATALLLATGVFLLETALGNRAVLGWGVGQLGARVAGSVEVDDVRSANLLRGARLVGVRLSTSEGEPFVEADSLELSYSLLGLLRGALAFEDVHIWRPRVVLDRDSTGAGSLARWIRGGVADPSEAGEGGGFALRVDGLDIVDGALSLRLPADLDPEGLFRATVAADGSTQRAIDLRDLDAQFGRLELSPEVGVQADIQRGSAEVDVLKERFHLDGLRGDVSVLDGRLQADLMSVSAPGLDGSGTIVADWSGGEGVFVDIDATLPQADLKEWRWVSPVLPAAEGSLDLRAALEPGRQSWTGSSMDLGWEGGGRVRGRGTILRAGGVRFEGVDLALADMPVTALDPYLAEPIEPVGALDGQIVLSGAPTSLQVEGDLTLERPDGPPVLAVFEGGVGRAGNEVAFRGFRATLDPVDYGLVGRLVPGFRLTGEGRAVLSGTGSLRQGLAFTANVNHSAPAVGSSNVLVSGNVFITPDDEIRVDVQGDLAPLSLDAVARDFGDLPIGGAFTGPVRARGLLRDLEVTAQLQTPEGAVGIEGRLDLRDPGSRYSIQATVEDFLASDLVASLPSPTVVTGRLEVDGSGLDPATLDAETRVEVDRARVQGVGVDSLRAFARVVGGQLRLDSLVADVAGFTVEGSGTLAADSTGPAGEMLLAFSAPDLTGIRAITRGDTVLTGDDLTPLDRDVLLLRGVDPDTLPTAIEVRAEGRVEGEVRLAGGLSDFDAVGWVEGEQLRYGPSSVEGGRVDFEVAGLPGLAGALHADVVVDSTHFAARDFSGGTASIDFERPLGRAVLELARDSSEEYRMQGRFELDSLGGAVDVDELTVRLDSLVYRSAYPTRMVWTDSVFSVDSLQIVGAGSDPVRIRAEGTLPRRGAADFDLDITGLSLARLARVAQREDLDVQGTVDFVGSVRGTARSPRVEGDVSVRGLEARQLSLERLEGTLAYADLDVDVGLDAWARGRRVLRVEGQWPASFHLDGSEEDVSDREVDLEIRADSLPATLVLSLLEDLEDTRGAVFGTLDVGGTPSALEPRGQLRLERGEWTVGALGVRQEQVEATFDLVGDRQVAVVASGRSGGSVDVTGTIQLDTLTNPALDLDIVLSSFNAVDRRDISGAVSGDLELLGRYGQPVIQGALQVERGDLFLDEFARNVGVIDLSDPRFFTYIDDADLLASRPLLAETRNPFLDNLLVNIELGVQRNTWLRSTQLNVEMRGDLFVTYDRRRRDVVMIGDLQAVRGQYQFGNQSFEVEGGAIEFLGIPGINPNLNVQASTEVRRRQDEPLTIDAQVGGTLIEPRVELSTGDAAVSETDIFSYLTVGQPASALTADQAIGNAFDGVTRYLGGTLTSSLSSLAQGAGWLDYFAISQAFDPTAVDANTQAGFGSTFAGTQVEVGRYFGGDYFGALMFRPLVAAGGTGSLLGGARIEWQASEQYQLELFAEDQFLRNQTFGVRDFRGDFSLIFGFLLFREWGY